ncbi:MAG: fibronectin type III domain-containing protein [Candidatus Kapabacteria bacterium]|nr:fibronectin type III domain-containing protein [Candidatus Kapabacteria bacterium]
MPVVVNNNFAQDTYGMRTERLIAIQGNFTMIQPALQSPAHIATWAEDCFDVYSNLLALSGLEMNESEGATAIVAEKVDALEEAYQNVKFIGTSIYTDMPNILKEYEFETAFPQSRDDMFRRVDTVILAFNEHTTEGVTPLIPQTLITGLTVAREELKTAIDTQDKERFDARHAVTVASERFVEDTKKLKQLKSWTFVMLGKQDDRVNLIGMVNPDTGGNSGPVPAAPTNLTVDISTMVFSWDPVEGNITSYQLMASVAGVEWIEIYSGSDNFVHFIPTSENYHQYKIRGRNENGFGNYSLLLLYNHVALAAPGYVSLTVTNASTGEVALNWENIVAADFFRVYVCSVATGAPAVPEDYSLAGEFTVASFSATFGTGMRKYFYVKSGTSGGLLSSASDAVYADL